VARGTSRRVHLTGRVPREGRPLLWAFGYADYGDLFEVEPESARQMVKRGQFDPSDLASVCRLWCKRHGHEAER